MSVTVWLLTEPAGVPTMNSWPTRWGSDMLASTASATLPALSDAAPARARPPGPPGDAAASRHPVTSSGTSRRRPDGNDIFFSRMAFRVKWWIRGHTLAGFGGSG